MENVVKKYILNLVEIVDQDFQDYFKDNDFEILQRSDVKDMQSLDFIFVDSSENAIEASRDFASDKHDITIVCIGPVENFQKFLIHEGRLCISDKILESEVGSIILDNFFKQEKSIHLGESFGQKFEKINDFSVTNHLSAGDSFDQACYHALKSGFNLLSLRTFLDHSLMYLSYLKQSGEGEFPFVYEYSVSKEIFAINIQLNVQDFFAEYLFDSFGKLDTELPQKYLLSVLVQTCDYLDICYLNKSNKLVISGLWNKSGENTLKGVGIHQIETVKKQVQKRENKAQEEFDLAKSLDSHKIPALRKLEDLPGELLDSKFKLEEESVLEDNFDVVLNEALDSLKEQFPDQEVSKISEEDLTKVLPKELLDSLSINDKEVLLENIRKSDIKELIADKLEVAKEEFKDDSEFQDELINTSADTLAEEVSQKVKSNSLEEFLESTLVKGKRDKPEDKIIVGGDLDIAEDERFEIKGGKESADNFKKTVKGLDDNDISDFVKHFSTNLNEKEAVQVIKGGKSSINDMTTKWVVKSLNNSKKTSSNVKAYLRDAAPKRLSAELDNFAKKLGKTLETLSADELNEFKTKKLPEVISNMMNGDESIEEFANKVENIEANEGAGVFDFDKMSERDPELNEFANEFKEKLVQKIKKLGADVPKEELQQALKQTVKDKIAEILEDDSLSKDEKEEKKTVLITQMSETLGISKKEVQAMISSGTTKSNKAVVELVKQKVVDSGNKNDAIGISAIDAQLSLKLKQVEAENLKLKDSIKALKLQGDARNSVDLTVEDLRKQVKSESEKIVSVQEQELQVEKEQLLEKLDDIENLSKEDKSKIAQLLNAGVTTQTIAKKEVRKLELEADTREVVFSQELERAEKALKAKDYVIQKAKEAMRGAIAKKDKELSTMKSQLHNISQKVEGGNSAAMEKEFKQIKNENETLSKTAEIYKKKLETLSKRLNETKQDDNSAQIAEENRTLKRIRVNLEKQVEHNGKTSKKIEEKLQKASSAELKLKVANKTLESDLKAVQFQLRKLKEQSSTALAGATKVASTQNEQLTRENELAKAKNIALAESLKQTEAKLTQVVSEQKMAKINEVSDEAVEQKFTSEIKRLNSELELSRSQSEALQGKIDQITKATKLADKDQAVGNKGAVDPVKQRLERSVKKLNSEMVKAQSESTEHKRAAMKASKEVVGLKNQLALLKKELEKAKKANSAKTKKAA